MNEKREQQILDDISAKSGKFGGEARILYANMMAMSRGLQYRLLGGGAELRKQINSAPAEMPKAQTVACLGQKGSFSHEALKRLFPNASPLFSPDFQTIFEAVACGAAGLGVLPVENSSAGSVGDVYDLILKYRFFILGALSLPICQCIASSESSIEKIRAVYSHPQALRQCSNFLASHGWETTPFSSTTEAAESAAGKPGTGAVCSAYAARECGLNVLAENIQDAVGNRTRFIVIGRKMALPRMRTKSACASPCRTAPARFTRCWHVSPPLG